MEITTNTTLNVPSQYATLAAAMTWLRGRVIAPGVTVTIQIANGTYTASGPVDLGHQQGSQVQIVGNVGNPASVVLEWSNGGASDALLVRGQTLGLLNGVTIRLPAKAAWPNNGTGLLALDGATIYTGSAVRVNNFYYGIAARNGSHIYCPGVTVDAAGDVGIWAFVGSSIDCAGATSTNAADATNNLGWGIQAEYGSAVNCSSAIISGCRRGGIGALSGSSVRAYAAISQSNTGHGLFAENGGSIVAHNAQTINNAGFGIWLGDAAMGVVVGSPITNTGNTSGTVNTSAQMDVTGGQARLLFTAPSGARIDNQNAAGIYFNTAGGAQFAVEHRASAVNRLVARGNSTGAAPDISADGADSNIDLALIPKGTGRVRFGAYQARAAIPVTGFIEVRDQAGNIRRLLIG